MEPPEKRPKTDHGASLNARERQREYALRLWFQDTQSSNLAIRRRAQARLQLQLNLRSYRRVVEKWTEQLRAAKKAGNSQEINKRLKENVNQLRIWETVLRSDFSLIPTKKNKWMTLATIWSQGSSPPLDKILNDANEDYTEDFPHDPSLHMCGTSRSHIRHELQRRQGYEKEGQKDRKEISVNTSGTAKNHVDKGILKEFPKSPPEAATNFSPIWNRHQDRMIKRYITTGMPMSMATTKLAIQKEAFERHAQLESDAGTAHAITNFMTADKSRDILTNNSTRMRTHRVHNRGLWKLASTKLWIHYEDADCWELPRWTPGGHLYIETSYDGLSNIHLDFGHRTFNVAAVALPNYVRSHPLPLKATCFETGADVFMGLTPLANGFLKVHMPTLAIVQVDDEVKMLSLARNVVELVGVCSE
jgi:hypothetical protein